MTGSGWMRVCASAIGAALLAGCGDQGARPGKVSDDAPRAGKAPKTPKAPKAPKAPKVREALVARDWRVVATDNDRRRLRLWREAWEAVLPKIAGDPRIVAEGALLQPDAALDTAAPPPGDYSCRVIKLGAQTKGMPDFAAFPPFACRVAAAGALSSLAKLTGSQRPTGLLYPDPDGRLIFLGTMVLGDETRAQAYGRDPERDMAGLVERVGPKRWRLVLPYPKWESMLDVVELVPAG